MFRVQTQINETQYTVDCADLNISNSHQRQHASFSFEGFNYLSFVKALEDVAQKREKINLNIRYIPDAALTDGSPDMEFDTIADMYILNVSRHCISSTCLVNVHLGNTIE